MKKNLDIILAIGSIGLLYLGIFKLKPFLDKRKEDKKALELQKFKDDFTFGNLKAEDFKHQTNGLGYICQPPC